jgi:hypothetical protein
MTQPAEPAPTTMKSNSVKVLTFKSSVFHGHWSGGKIRFEDISKPQEVAEFMRFSLNTDFQERLPKFLHLLGFVEG